MPPLKILVLSDVGSGQFDQGDKIRLTNFTSWLAGKNDLTLLTFGEGHQEGLRAAPITPPGLPTRIIRTILAPHLPVTVASRQTGRMKKAVEHLTGREKYDVALVYQAKMAAYLPYLNCPAVVDLTDALSLYYGRLARYAGSLGRFFYRWEEARMRWFEKNLLARKRLGLLASEVDAHYLGRLVPGARLKVVPNGVDTGYFSPLQPAGEGFDLVFTGNMAYRPNKDGLLFFYREVFPLVVARHPGVRLVVVGKNPPRDILALQGDPGVTVTGYVPDVRPYLAEASVFVSPLRFGAGTRLKILEAMAMGKAVVSTSLGVEGLKVAPGFDLEVADEPQVMAGKIIELLQDEGKRSALGNRARETVWKEYRWESICATLEELLVTEAQCFGVGAWT